MSLSRTPASLTREDSDATIFMVMFDQTWTKSRLMPEPQIWSREQERWLNEAEYAAEWRHRNLYRQVMGNASTAMQMNREGL